MVKERKDYEERVKLCHFSDSFFLIGFPKPPKE